MTKKMRIVTLLIVVMCFLGAFTVVTLNQKHDKMTQEESLGDMPRFPSYDWSGEDHSYLAYVSANTPGTDINKQKAIINVLTNVWENKTDIKTWVERNYELYNDATERDYELVWMVIQGEWATE